MAEVTTIVAEPRDRAGKGSARAARREGRVPCVIYGEKQDPEIITVAQNELIRLINRGGFMNHQYDIEFGGKTERVLPRDLQTHPISDLPMHLDFLRVSKDTKVSVEVPVHVIEQDKSPGLKRGGVLNLVRDTVELVAPAGRIPESIEISVAGLDINDQARISRASLPDGVSPAITDRDFVVATISAPSALKSQEGEAAEDGAGEVDESDD
ncbi:MAG: 50S ribosomal protein L25/general stress protein Ctc [Rhodothalassiaceae bacterium]